MSSTDVKIFEKEEFGSVRVVMQGDDPWFVASDVAKSLGYDNPANAINTHCKKINKITLSPDLGGREISSKMPPVVMNIIPESDVYRLVMRSNLPNAVAFQDCGFVKKFFQPFARRASILQRFPTSPTLLKRRGLGLTSTRRTSPSPPPTSN